MNSVLKKPRFHRLANDQIDRITVKSAPLHYQNNDLGSLGAEIGRLPLPVEMFTEADNAIIADSALLRALTDQQAIRDKPETLDLLRETEIKYRTLVELIPAITYVASLESPGKLLYLSPQVDQLGFPQEYWLDDPQSWLKQVHADDHLDVVEAFAHTYEHYAPLRCEYRLVRSDGQVRWFLDKAIVVRDEAGQGLFLQGILVDITNDKEIEQELFYFRRRLDELVAQRTEQIEKQCAILKSANASLGKSLSELRQLNSALRTSE
ncbi:MAG: PAS domain-containing protein [Methylococcales bacterium]